MIDVKELNKRIDRHERFMELWAEAHTPTEEQLADLHAELKDAFNERLDGNHRARCQARAMQKVAAFYANATNGGTL